MEISINSILIPQTKIGTVELWDHQRAFIHAMQTLENQNQTTTIDYSYLMPSAEAAMARRDGKNSDARPVQVTRTFTGGILCSPPASGKTFMCLGLVITKPSVEQNGLSFISNSSVFPFYTDRYNCYDTQINLFVVPPNLFNQWKFACAQVGAFKTIDNANIFPPCFEKDSANECNVILISSTNLRKLISNYPEELARVAFQRVFYDESDRTNIPLGLVNCRFLWGVSATVGKFMDELGKKYSGVFARDGYISRAVRNIVLSAAANKQTAPPCFLYPAENFANVNLELPPILCEKILVQLKVGGAYNPQEKCFRRPKNLLPSEDLYDAPEFLATTLVSKIMADQISGQVFLGLVFAPVSMANKLGYIGWQTFFEKAARKQKLDCAVNFLIHATPDNTQKMMLWIEKNRHANTLIFLGKSCLVGLNLQMFNHLYFLDALSSFSLSEIIQGVGRAQRIPRCQSLRVSIIEARQTYCGDTKIVGQQDFDLQSIFNQKQDEIDTLREQKADKIKEHAAKKQKICS